MAALVALLFACSKPGLPPGDERRPDVIFVSVDTLRADHLSAWGYDRPTSPFMDSLAARGARYVNAFSSSPWTLPAHTTMMTGLYPMNHRVVEDSLSLDPGTPVLAETMRGAGYATAGFVSTLYVSRLFGFERGFDHFEDFGIDSERENLAGDVAASQVVDEALEWWADQPAGQPTFLFLHFYDVHYEYDPPPPYDTLFDRAPVDDDRRFKNYAAHKKKPLAKPEKEHQLAQYDEAIRYVDDQLKRLSDTATAAGRQVRWVVTADHGEEFGERGSWGHAHTLYAEQLHVPLILAGKGVPEGWVVDTPVGLVDVAPTIAAWTGSGFGGDGRNLLGGPLKARPMPAETSRFSTNRLSLLEDGLRLEWDLRSKKQELFAPLDDPKELRDLAAERPEDVARLATDLETMLGAPWEASAEGTVQTQGIILRGGPNKTLAVKPGDRFSVLPYDAELSLVLPDGSERGPWVGTTTPPGDADPLALRARGATASVDLDARTREQLEALGYVQGDDGGAGDDGTKGEPAPPGDGEKGGDTP